MVRQQLVENLDRGQANAALSLGMTELAAFRLIVLPQAFRTVIPPLGNLLIAMIRNSAIVGASLLALPDLMKQARIIESRTFQTHAAFLWAALGYLLLTALALMAFAANSLMCRLALGGGSIDPA